MRIDLARLGALLLVAQAVAPARAETSPWSFGAGLTVGSESNVFRNVAGQEISDRYSALSLFGNLDQSVARQRLRGSATVRREDYDNRVDLDNTAYGLSAEWIGSTAGELSWKLALSAQRNLASYATVLEPERRVPNSETSRQVVAAAQLGLVAQWIASLTFSRRSIDYSAAAYADDQYRLDSLGANAQWNPVGPLSVSVGPRLSRGRFPFARTAADGSTQEDGFSRRDLDLMVDWRASGASTLVGRVSVTRQRYDQLSQRDFSGATGQLSWRWVPTGKTTVDLAWSRDTGSETSFFSVPFLGTALRGTGDNSELTSRLTGKLSYQLGGKSSLSLAGQYAERQLAARSTLGDGTVELSRQAGQDRSASITLGAAWAPTRSVDLDCALTHSRRASLTILSSSYRSDAANCSMRITVR